MKTMRKDSTAIPAGMIALYVWLVLITLIAVLFGGETFIPIDARTDMPAHGVHLSFPLWGSLVEPVTALFHILETFPDYRTGVLALLIWLTTVVFAFTFVSAYRREPLLLTAILRGLRGGIVAMLLYAVYIFCALTTHFPSWSLQKDRPGIVAADLHSHSLLSHDGIISARENLLLHRQHGYDLVALTDHINPQGPFVAYLAADESTAAAVPGIEMPVYYGDNFYLTALGMSADTPLPDGLSWTEEREEAVPSSLPPNIWSIKRFIDTVHQHHGVVNTVALNLDAEDVFALAKAGVDGFEFINSGHKPLSEKVRQAMLTVQRNKGVALLASTDWHGWSGGLIAWTLITPPANRQAVSPTKIVLEALRHHDSANITPVVAYPVHAMGWFETAISPFTSIFLYAKTMSVRQLQSWWVWTGLLSLLMASDFFRGVSPARQLQRTCLMAAGALELTTGVTMMLNSFPMMFSSPLNFKVSCYCIGLGFLLLLIGRSMARLSSATDASLRLNARQFLYIALWFVTRYK